MRCPDATEIADFAARVLDESRLDVVESHVADCTECRALVFALAEDAPSSRERIGRFEVEGEIGSGAMGVVYRARDPELDRNVAIKVHAQRSRLAFAGEERLRREAQALARLSHPNVVAVYEAGRHQDTTFVAMELVEGLTLDDWLLQPHSLAEVIAAFVQAGHGLAAAHAAGLVHRDIKPRNVFVCASTGAVKIGDFGLVRALETTHAVTESPRDLAVALSIDGALVGTPAYMAPEQLRGEAATAASDQFSFCAMLFEAVYGVRPFSGSTVSELLAAMTAPPVVPARMRRVPRRVRAVLERGLRVDPDLRFGSMTALLAVLAPRAHSRWPLAVLGVAAIASLSAFALTRDDPAAVCDAESTTAERVFASTRVDQLAPAMIATGAPRASDIAARVTRELDEYAASWRTASTSICRATTTGQQSAQLGERQRACLERRLQRVDELLGLLLAPDAATVTHALDATLALEAVDSCTRIGHLDDRDPPSLVQAGAVARLERTLDHVDTLRRLGQIRSAADQITPALAEARTIAYSPLLARALTIAASVLGAQSGNLADREALLLEALQEAARARDDTTITETYADLVYLVGVDGKRLDAALQWATAGEAALLRAGNPINLRWALQLDRAAVLGRQGNLDEAIRLLEGAIASRAHEEPSVAIADAHNNVAGFLLDGGRIVEAEAHLDTALKIYRDTYGTDEHPKVINALMNLGVVFLDRGDIDNAVMLLERARIAGEVALGPDHVYLGTIFDALGECERQRGHVKRAIELHRRALAILTARLGRNHARSGVALTNLADVLSESGEYDEARRSFIEAIAILTETYGASHETVLRTRVDYGMFLRETGQRAAARREIEAALVLLQPSESSAIVATAARDELAKL